MVVTGTHDPYLVALSILVASFASYTALDLSGHVGTARGFARSVWLVAAAITMGGGIWSMHFVAMLAFIMPIPMSYDIGLTTLSLVVAMVVTGGGFYVISRQSGSLLRLVLSGIFMGLGIAAMHYTAMTAAIFTAHDPVHEVLVNASLDQTSLALAVAGITFIILALASVASLFERKRAEEALRQAQADLARVNRVNTMAELTASLAHEVNQPISAAVTAADACLTWL